MDRNLAILDISSSVASNSVIDEWKPDISVIEIDPANCQSCGVVQTSSGHANLFERGPEIATQYHGRVTGQPVSADKGALVWADFSASGPLFDGAVVAQRYEAFGGGPVTDLGGSCGKRRGQRLQRPGRAR